MKVIKFRLQWLIEGLEEHFLSLSKEISLKDAEIVDDASASAPAPPFLSLSKEISLKVDAIKPEHVLGFLRNAFYLFLKRFL